MSDPAQKIQEYYRRQKEEAEAKRRAEEEAAKRKAEEKRRRAQEEAGLMVPKQTISRKGKPWYSIARQEPTPMMVPEQTVRDKTGRVLYTIKAGEQPGTYVQTVPGETVTETVQTGTMYSTAPITRPPSWVDPGDPAPESQQYLDAVDDVGRQVGEQALETIEGTHPEAYRGFAHVQQEKAAQRYEQILDVIPSALTRQRTQLQIEAYEAKIRGDDLEAGIKYGETTLLAATKGAYLGLTWRLRPWIIPQSLAAGADLFRDPVAFQGAVDRFTADPMNLYAGVAGGLLGEVAATQVQGFIGGKIREANIRELAKSWEPSQQLPGEEELGMAYPEAYTVQRTAHRGLEEVKDVGILPYKEGDPYLFGDKMTLKNLEINDAIFKKAYLQTGGGTDLILVPPETPLMPVYKPIPDVEIAPSWKPGVRYTWGDATITRKTLRTTPLGLIEVKPVSLDKLALKETQIMTQIERQLEMQLTKTLSKEMSLTKLTPRVTIIDTPDITETTRQKQTQTIRQKQVAIVKEAPILKQVFEEPTFTITDIITEEQTHRRPRIRLKPSLDFPTEKKKKKRGKKGAFEFRVDFKEPKLPDIKDIKIPGFETGGKKKGKKKKQKYRIF